MRIWLILTIAVAASIGETLCAPLCSAAPSVGARYEAPAIFNCTFDSASDADSNGWPDGWTRQHSPAYPRYVEVRIDSAAPPTEGRSLRFDLDGGAAATHSPPIPARDLFSYAFEAVVQTEGLVHDRAFISVTFYDSHNKLLERCVSSPVEGTTAWTRLRIGPLVPSNPATHHAVLGLHLEPGDQADLKGTAWFGDVWAGRLPRLALSANRRDHFYVDPDQPEINCTASGFADSKAFVVFQLLDVEGHELQRTRLLLDLDAEPGSNAASSVTRVDKATAAAPSDSTILAGHAVWRPSLPDVGFYRVRCSLNGQTDDANPKEVSLALIRHEAGSQRGEFGWTLPRGEQSITLDQLAELAAHAGINWLKLPVWNAGGDARRCDRLAAFAERLQERNVKFVGMLVDPPAEARKQFDAADPLVAAQIFLAKPEVWLPSLEPIMNCLSQTVKWWQLGSDDDFSFVNFAEMTGTIENVQQQLGSFGQKVQLGCAWPLNRPLPADKPTWSFVAFSTTSATNHTDQPSSDEDSANKQVHRWVAVDPLPAGAYSPSLRARDLAQQMLAAKLHCVDGIFLPAVLSSQRGLLNDDGTVGELLLPWRTTALALAGADCLGSLRMPHGSTNHVFVRDRQLMVMLWNDTPCEEQLSLGDKVQQINLWGAHLQPLRDEQERQRVRAEELPSFLAGLNEPLVRWQMLAALEQSQWPSTFGVPLQNGLAISNPFQQAVSGTVRCVLPDRWRMTPRELAFKLPAGATTTIPFEIMLPLDASTGPQEVRLDFDLAADAHYKFSVYRTIAIGDHDVYAQVTTRLDGSGDLVVEQTFVNQTDQPLSFKCSLFAPDRRRMFAQVPELGHGTDLKTFRLQDGKSLLGKTLWLHAEQDNGERILNYRFVAKP